jgi:hypothetical protein
MSIGFTGGVPNIGFAITMHTSMGKLAAPVARSEVIYAQFRHVEGVAAPEGSQGVSVTKLQILNTLITNLSQAKSRKSIQPVTMNEAQGLTDKQIDALIDQYQSQIHELTSQASAQAAASSAATYVSPEAPAAAVFSLLA